MITKLPRVKTQLGRDLVTHGGGQLAAAVKTAKLADTREERAAVIVELMLAFVDAAAGAVCLASTEPCTHEGHKEIVRLLCVALTDAARASATRAAS